MNTGGSAFPTTTYSGITKRDYFAAKAMLGEITHQGLECCDPEHIAGMAYEMADAMLKARENNT